MNTNVNPNPNTPVAVAKTSSKRPVGRPVDPTSALSRARVIAQGMPANSTRKETIAKFQSEGGLTKGVASAYYTVINRKK